MSESQDPSAERSAAAGPVQSQRTMPRRAVVVGIAAGAATVLGGAAYLAYALTPKERFYPRPPILTYTGHGLARDAAWSPDGTRGASTGWPYGGGTAPRAVHVWDATTGKRLLLCTLEDAATGRAPAGVVWSADGGRLLAIIEGPVSSALDRVQEWDAVTGQRVRSIPVRRTATVWAMNDRYLAVATQVAPQQAGAQRGALMGALTPSTPAPAATPTQPPTPSPPAHSTPTPPATLTPARPTPIPSPRDVIEVWELATGRLVAALDPDVPSANNSIANLVWAPESSKLAVFRSAWSPGQSSNAWQFWDAPAGKELQTIGIPTGEYDALAWSRDGKSLALGSGVYDVETGRRMATYRVDGYLYGQAWTPDGRRIAVWVRTGTGLYATKYDVISLVEASSGRQIAIYNGGESDPEVGPVGRPSPMAWSPDGKHLLVVRRGVEVWRLAWTIHGV
jgi:WD40 repeat protein